MDPEWRTDRDPRFPDDDHLKGKIVFCAVVLAILAAVLYWNP